MVESNSLPRCVHRGAFLEPIAMNDLPSTHPSFLLRLADRDDREAWEEFARMVTPVLRRVAHGRGLQSLDADELVQEVLVTVMNTIGSYEPAARPGSFRRWLLTVARNAAVNHLCRRPRDQRMRDGSIALEHLAASVASPAAIEESIHLEWQSELFALACRAVQPQLQPSTWTAFWKTAVEGKAAASVAEELGMNLGSVYVARSRVLAKIKNWVQASSQLWESEG